MKRKALFTMLVLWMTVASSNAQQCESFTISTISDEVFARMHGKSYPDGCLVDRDDLRYLQVLYCDADGITHSGEIVCNKLIAEDLIDIFNKLFLARYPIELVSLIDNFDADDEKSMTANNTSCFCYRTVNGSTKLSKHAQGLAIDINPLYNPCVRTLKDGTLKIEPKAGKRYANRKKSSKYKLRKDDLCYRLFTEHGFFWGGNWNSVKDYQHFEK